MSIYNSKRLASFITVHVRLLVSLGLIPLQLYRCFWNRQLVTRCKSTAGLRSSCIQGQEERHVPKIFLSLLWTGCKSTAGLRRHSQGQEEGMCQRYLRVYFEQGARVLQNCDEATRKDKKEGMCRRCKRISCFFSIEKETKILSVNMHATSILWSPCCHARGWW